MAGDKRVSVVSPDPADFPVVRGAVTPVVPDVDGAGPAALPTAVSKAVPTAVSPAR
jgi:hypothetical protein